jgi:type II secretory pathway pseudopilin PulG
MIGKKYNNINQKKGQVLLLVAMIMATVLTLTSAVVFRSTTEIQTTKLEEQSQKALAAAEAAIEAALKQGNTNIQSLPGFSGSNITGSATVDTTQSRDFVTPLLQKDEQYTLYLSNPGGTVDNPNFSVLNTYYNNQALTICSTSPTVALEITLIKSNNSVIHFAINPPGSTIIENGQTANNNGLCPNTESFSYKHQLSTSDIGSNNLLLIVRVINGSAKIGFRGDINLPLQGKTITSTATSSTGVTKKVVLFQSYPQIPSDFFVTSF